MVPSIGTLSIYNGLKQAVLRKSSLRFPLLRVSSAFQEIGQKNGISTTSPCNVKESKLFSFALQFMLMINFMHASICPSSCFMREFSLFYVFNLKVTLNEEENKIVIEGKYISSPREKYLAKFATNITGCQECSLCKLGLKVRHTVSLKHGYSSKIFEDKK